MKSIYNYNDYRDLLADYLARKDRKSNRGHLSLVAKIANCQSAYISRVFSQGANLSLEQGEKLADYLSFDLDQKEYFYHLILKDRAGTVDLRKFYEEKIKDKQIANSKISEAHVEQNQLSEEQTKEYYSSWTYSAIHIIVGIKEYQTPDAIATRLQLSPNYVLKILNRLLSWNLISKQKERYIPSQDKMHLSYKSDFLKTHHQNWRFQAIKNINENMKSNLHYSSVTCISREAKEEIERILLKAIEEMRSEIRSSTDDQVLYGVNLDFYRV